jgi:3-oxoacyl-[acyl-carrier-protein] synthase-3
VTHVAHRALFDISIGRLRAVKFARLGPIAVHLPERVETIDDLRVEQPSWDVDLIYSKTGIRNRHIAAPGECSSDLAVAAAEKLFRENDIDRHTVDFVLLCTQTPDYPLPTTACLVQDRLGLRLDVGAMDFNLGCSGYVYGLSLADGLIRGGVANRVLLLTAETYTRFIDPTDRSLRTIFGDGAAATLIDAVDSQSLGGFVFGTDGRGADTLIVNSGGARPTKDAIQPRKRKRWPSALYMDGPALMEFTIEAIPRLVDAVLARAHAQDREVDFYLFHQATHKMLENLRERMNISIDRLPECMENVGNTVSSTIPILIDHLRRAERLRPEMQSMLVGFGVGYSWGGCLWRDTWRGT